MGLVVGFLLLLGLGFMWWQAFSKFNPPEELRPYAYREGYVALLDASEGVLPSISQELDSADLRLDSLDLHFFLGAVDSVDAAWGRFAAIYEAAKGTGGIDPNEPFDPMELDSIGIEFHRVSFYARQNLVGHLNDAGLSWNDYIGIKARVVAASGITPDELRDSLHQFMEDFGMDVDREATDLPNPQLFARADSLRDAGAIDSSAIALVVPHRSYLLGPGIHTLIGTDEAFYGE